MSRDKFRGMDKQTREQFWVDLCAKFQKYQGNRVEFLKEHNISSSAFDRWNKKFNKQRIGNIPGNSDNLNKSQAFSMVSVLDNAIQQSVDVIDDSHLLDNVYDDLDKKLSELGAHDNPIMAAIELVLPDGLKVRLANHADVAMAIRLVQGIVQHD